MPQCPACDRYLTPTSLTEEGGCPGCGRILAARAEVKAPWHFKLLLVALVLYLSFRLLQLFQWLAHLL